MTNENQVKNEEMGSVDLEEQKIDEENLNAKETNAEDGVAESDDSLNNKVIELKDQLLRSVAELDNYRKRVDREKEQLRKFGIANFAKELLAVADNLRRALESGPSELAGADEKVKNLIVGVEMTEKELLGAFEKNGVRQINPLGEKFDYNFHQAMFEVEAEDKEPGIVVQVLQPGYAREDRILRAAMVGVSKSRGADQPEGLDEKA